MRLFSRCACLDSITVAHKFVEDIKFLLECFTVISKGKCFLSTPTANLYSKHNKKSKKCTIQAGVRNCHNSLFQCFPQWFTPNKGGTIYEWICAFLEYTLLSKYLKTFKQK